MKNINLALVSVLTTIFYVSLATAAWDNVVPALQSVTPSGSDGPHTLSDTLMICYLSDSLEWATEEFAQRLVAKDFVCIPKLITSLSGIKTAHLEVPNADQLLLMADSRFLDSLAFYIADNSPPHTAPTLPSSLSSSESYGIWIRSDSVTLDDPGLTRFVGAVFSKTLRGLLYGITSFDQGLQGSPIPEDPQHNIRPAVILDYPTFPRRVIGEPYDLFSATPWATPSAHAEAILVSARDLLLKNKGNGFLQFGSVDATHTAERSTVYSTLKTGNTTGSHVDSWENLTMDWYQGAGKWGGTDYMKMAGRTTGLVYKEVSFGSIDYAPNTPQETIEVLPNLNEYSVPNFDFEDASFDQWRDVAGWSTPSENGNSFARSAPIGGSNVATISRFVHLQDSVGLPMRQLVLEFAVRLNSGTSADVWIESIMPPDSNGLPSSSSDTFGVGDFRIFDFKRVETDARFKHSITATEWDTLHVLFYSYGLKYDYLNFRFKSTGGNNVSVDFDGIRLMDSDNYYVSMLSTANGRPLNDYARLVVEIDSAGQWFPIQTIYGQGLRQRSFDNQCNEELWSHSRILLRREILNRSLESLQSSIYRGRLYYHALCVSGLPAFVDTLSPLQPFRKSGDSIECDLGTRATFWQMDSCAQELAIKVDTVSHLWETYGPDIQFSGFFNRNNEQRTYGWSEPEVNLADSNNWSLAGMYADFNAHVADSLNERLNTSVPLLLFADMFDPYHNGQLISRVNNPFAPLNGYDPDSTEFSEYSVSQPLVFVDWWSKEVDTIAQANGIVNSFDELLQNSDNWEAMFTFLPEDHPDSSEYRERFPLYRSIARACSLRREDDRNFSGGGLLYDGDSTMSANWDEFRDREEFLQLWWKNDPISTPTVSFGRFVLASDSMQNATFRSYPVPYPEDREAEIDSVVLQYRFGSNTTSWSRQKVAFQSDSLYDFSISLPDSGGYVEYRVWSFDELGQYGSYPPYGTKWTDPEAGERSYFTFERRKDEAIVKPDTFWLPGVISKEHTVAPNGKLVFQPLPGYKNATLYVGDDAKITTTWVGSGSARPEIKFNGTDTTYIHVKPLCATCKWNGIFDSVGVVVKKNVTFHEGTGEALVLKDATGDSKAEFQSAAYEDTVVVKGPAEITGTVTFNKLIVEPGATLSILPGSEISFFEGGQLIVKKGGHLKAFGNDSTAIVFKAAVDSLPWEGIHFEADYQTAACSLKYVQVSGAVAGLLLDRAKGYVENCTFENNKFGVLANNGAWFEAKTCSLITNEVGVVATNLSSVELNDVFVGSNSGPGLKGLSRASFYLEDCVINENNGDGLAGGIGLYTGSSLFMECTEVDANTGSGITAYGGTVMLTSVKTVGDTLWQWQGNRIEHNATIPYEGQITLRNRVALALWNGNNCIWDTTGAGKLVHWEDQVGADRWADVYWGSTDTAAIKAKLPSSVTLVRIDSARTVCPTFTADNTVNDSLVHKFLFPHNAELSAQYTRADSGYKAIIRNAQSSDYAFTSCDRLLLTNLLDNKPFGAVVDTMEVLFGNVSDASLKRWLSNTKAWACAEQENFTKCRGILDSLATYTPVRFDRVAARVQVQMAEIRELRVDTTSEYKASDCIAYLDSAQKILEMMKVWNQTTISDSVVMYAPTTVEGEIMIAQPNGRLTILPHPGAEGPTIRFRGAGSIVVQGYDTQFLRGRLYVQGEADNRVNLDWDSTTAWINIESRRGYINMEHANLKGKGWVNLNEDIFETTRTPIFYADSCTFTGFEDGMWLHGVHDSCLISNCTFESMGGNAGGYSGQGSGLSIAMSDGIQFENCRFVNNDEYGIWTYDCDDILFNELEVSGSGSHGLMAWNSNNITIDCGDFNNNGDTLAEIWVEDGSINLVDGYSHIADSNGVLIYSGHPSYTDIEDGENSLELYTSSGTYLKSGDTTAVWDITYNAWAPLIPTAGGFFNKLYPSNPAKWTVDSSLANFIECGGGGGSSIGGQDLIVIGQDETSGTFSTNDGDLTAKRSFDVKADGTVKSGLVAKSSANRDHHSELTQWRAFREQSDMKGNRRIAIDLGKKFIDENPNSTLIPAAVVQLAALAKRAGSKANLSAYLEQKATETKDPSLRALFNRKSLVARAYEGDPVSGLSGLEKLAGSSVSRRDSICALADAVGIYQAFKSTHDLNPSLAFVKTESLPEFKARIRDLSMQLDGAETVHGVESNAIPTSYALYQNYPNPFNPSTDIRFDLPEAVRVELKIFNILGQEVVTLVDDVRAAGAYRILWDGKNANGLNVASGVYVYQLKTPNFQDAKKMMLIR